MRLAISLSSVWIPLDTTEMRRIKQAYKLYFLTLFILEIVLKALPVKFRLTSEVVDYSPLNNSVIEHSSRRLTRCCNHKVFNTINYKPLTIFKSITLSYLKDNYNLTQIGRH